MQILNESPELGLEPFLMDFLTKRQEEISEIQVAISLNNFKAIKTISHNWKGFSKPYGFFLLYDFAQQLEMHTDNRDLESCSRLLTQIEKYLELKETQINNSNLIDK